MAGQNIILMLLIGQTILVTVQMYADLSLYYSDVDEYDLIQTFQPELHLAFLVELKIKILGQMLWCLLHEQILRCN